MHVGYANSEAMRVCGVSLETARQIEGVQVETVAFLGIEAQRKEQLSGVFLGIEALGLFRAYVLEIALQVPDCVKAMKYLTELASQNGVTTHCEMMMGALNLPLEHALFDAVFNDDNIVLLEHSCEFLIRFARKEILPSLGPLPPKKTNRCKSREKTR
jgi:hypothetical protein